ncbi:hypothetical protein F5887DRAFT_289954 [Amanita rubescens]|nr:hypothetical protein F5887DRAFT_289954 [Amanita rubescens]
MSDEIVFHYRAACIVVPASPWYLGAASCIVQTNLPASFMFISMVILVRCVGMVWGVVSLDYDYIDFQVPPLLRLLGLSPFSALAVPAGIIVRRLLLTLR